MASKLVRTIYDFYVDSQGRILLSAPMLEAYNMYGEFAYAKMLIIDEEIYLQLSNEEMHFYHFKMKMDQKNQIVIPKFVRDKIGIELGSTLKSFEIEEDSNKRSLLLKV